MEIKLKYSFYCDNCGIEINVTRKNHYLSEEEKDPEYRDYGNCPLCKKNEFEIDLRKFFPELFKNV